MASAIEEVIVVDSLGGEVADIKLAIDTKELDVANPLVAFMILFTSKISLLSLQQVTTKKQNFFFHDFFRKISFLGGTDDFDDLQVLLIVSSTSDFQETETTSSIKSHF